MFHKSFGRETRKMVTLGRTETFAGMPNKVFGDSWNIKPDQCASIVSQLVAFR